MADSINKTCISCAVSNPLANCLTCTYDNTLTGGIRCVTCNVGEYLTANYGACIADCSSLN